MCPLSHPLSESFPNMLSDMSSVTDGLIVLSVQGVHGGQTVPMVDDSVESFVESCIEPERTNWVPVSELYQAYQGYVEAEGLFPVNGSTAFGIYFKQSLDDGTGPAYKKRRNTYRGERQRGYQGIALTDEARARIEEEEGENPLDQH